MDWMVARRKGIPSSGNDLDVLPVVLPPGWASRTAKLGQRLLWNTIGSECRERGVEIDAVVCTSPHYLPLLDLVPKQVAAIYYASDDYRSYDGWGHVATLEKEMVQRVDHAFFVSQGLMERALAEYGVDAAKVSVSMNATEERFFAGKGSFPVDPPTGRLMRPIAGVVGGINDRLDFDLLLECASLPELGSLLLVGPVPENPSASLSKVLEHPKCVAVGRQPHETIHEWFQCLDVGLVPYVETEFNRMCSPMRLFDHLASGAPVVATAACDQANAFPEHVSVCHGAEAFAASLKERLGEPRRHVGGIGWGDRAEAMLKILEGLPYA
ncbi:glycosyltransferase family 1 protein [Pontiella desulfatans]|uniref:glycosyltransferase family 1 protein n=1 Tax=Pontiella desulfatans TaxID=2750659 RepID=UPI00109CBB0F|nr:glycosyltransferase family 1 protein [Pontiella desulfatans]